MKYPPSLLFPLRSRLLGSQKPLFNPLACGSLPSCTRFLFPTLLISGENCLFLSPGSLSLSLLCFCLIYLTNLAHSVTCQGSPGNFNKCVWKKSNLSGNASFFASKKTLVIFLSKQALGGQEEPVFRGRAASTIMVCV